MNILKKLFIITIFLVQATSYSAEHAAAAAAAPSSSSSSSSSSQEAKPNKKRKAIDEGEGKGTNIFLVNRALLIGKVQVIKKELKKLAYLSNNKFIRNFLGTIIEDSEKIGVSNNEELFKQLDILIQKLNQIKAIPGITESDVSKINEVQEKINSLKANYIKNIDLSHFKKNSEEEQKMEAEANIKDVLDLNDVEAFTQEPFIDLITIQQKKKLPYILARVETKDGVHYFDAHSLNNYMFNKYPIYPDQDKWGISPNNILHKKENYGFVVVEDILNRSPLIIDNIHYFTINSLKDEEFKYLNSFYDLITDKKIQKYFYYNYDYLYVPDQTIPIAPGEIDLHYGEVKWLPDGTKFAFGAQNKINIMDLNTGQIIRTFNSEDKEIKFTFSPDSSQIIFTNGDTIDIMDINSGNLIKSFNPYKPEDYGRRYRNEIKSIFYLPGDDPKIIAIIGDYIRLRGLNSGTLSSIYNNSAYSSRIALSDDYSKIAIYLRKDKNLNVLYDILIIDANSLQNILKDIKVDPLQYDEIIFSPEGSRILAINKKSDNFGKPFNEYKYVINIKTWDYESGRLIKDLKFDSAFGGDGKFSPDASKFIDSSVIFDTTNGKVIGNLLNKSHWYAWSKDSSKIAAISLDKTKTWNLEIYTIK